MWLWSFVRSSIGKKLLMALSGLFFCVFLLVHLEGNIMLYVGEEAFNHHVDTLASMSILSLPFIKIMEIAMVILFLIHIYTSAILTMENRAARPERYAMDVSAGKRTFMSKNMFITGSLILVFVVLHLIGFKFGEWSHEATALADPNNVTLYELVADKFSNIIWAGGYFIACILLGFHLNHAFQSAFQTLGLNHKKYTPAIKFIGTAYSIVVALGFASFPAYFYISQLTNAGG